MKFNFIRKLGVHRKLLANKPSNMKMNDNNKAIFDYLNDFVQVDEPDYSVFIKGCWGCGKTFFIQQWMKDVKEDRTENYDIDIKPIYVSLYGVNSVDHISAQIRKALYPLLNSKWVKNLKNIALTLGSAALKYNLKEGKEELSIDLDLLDIIKGNDNDSLKIKGKKILIFDDLERCKMPKEDVLGYINNFVEHSHCYVIILGDDTKLGDDAEKFEEIKEKTIGREFELTPDIGNAVDSFFKTIEPTEQNQLKKNRGLIMDLFKASKTNNLRILKHALSDYNQCVGKLPKSAIPEKSYCNVVRNLLSNFILCYLELLSSKKDEKDTEPASISGETKQVDAKVAECLFTEDERMHPLILCKDKYMVVSSLYHLPLPNTEFCKYILDYLYKGRFDSVQIDNRIKLTLKKPIEYLCDLSNITDEVFRKYFPVVKKAYFEEEYKNVSDIFDGGAILMYFAHEGLAQLDYKEIIQHADNMMKIDENDLSLLLQLENYISERKSYFSGLGIKEEIKELVDVFQRKVEEKKKSAKDKMTLYLEALNDKNIDKINDMLSESLPDHSHTNDTSAIFKQVDIDLFMKGYLSLGNGGKNIFFSSMAQHYQNAVGTVNAKQFIHYYEADIDPLHEIAKRMNDFHDKDKPISTLQTKKMAHLFETYADRIEKIAKS